MEPSPTGKAAIPPRLVPILTILGICLPILAVEMNDPSPWTGQRMLRVAVTMGTTALAGLFPGLRLPPMREPITPPIDPSKLSDQAVVDELKKGVRP